MKVGAINIQKDSNFRSTLDNVAFIRAQGTGYGITDVSILKWPNFLPSFSQEFVPKCQDTLTGN